MNVSKDCQKQTPDASARASSTESEKLASAMLFTLEDHQRLLRSCDVEGICESRASCFEYSDRVRCGPCAIQQSLNLGVQPDYTLPFAPEQYRLQRKLKAADAEIAGLRGALAKVICAYDTNDTDPAGFRDTIKADIAGYRDLMIAEQR